MAPLAPWLAAAFPGQGSRPESLQERCSVSFHSTGHSDQHDCVPFVALSLTLQTSVLQQGLVFVEQAFLWVPDQPSPQSNLFCLCLRATCEILLGKKGPFTLKAIREDHVTKTSFLCCLCELSKVVRGP